MRVRFETVEGCPVLVVEHDDGGRTLVAELSDGLVATLSLDAFHVRQLRYSFANRRRKRS